MRRFCFQLSSVTFYSFMLFFQAEDGIRGRNVTGVQTCALPIAVKAGLVLDVGVRGFIPASLLSAVYVEDLEQFNDQTLDVKVEDIDQDKNRVILNRKRIVEGEKSKLRQEELANLEIGSIIEGEVVRTTSFGAFIKIGNVDGLAHISELSYERVESVEDAVDIGQKVKVKVLDVKPEEERISLSI